MTRLAAFLLAALLACAPEPPPFQLAVADGEVQLAAAPGVKLNAEYDPRLILARGDTLRLTSDSISADSLWFATPPRAPWTGDPDELDGELRVSICDNDLNVCRLVTGRVRGGTVVGRQ